MARPPFDISHRILGEIDRISRLLGRFEGLHRPPPTPVVSRTNRVRTIQSTLEIEGNALSLDQVTAIIDGRRVAGPARDIREAENANRAYEAAQSLDPLSLRDFLRAHGIMMEGLIERAGKIRTGDIAVVSGRRVRHVAPRADRVRGLLKDLFEADLGAHPLVGACVFHYEIAFIHPFEDGNGRLGRLWQHVLSLAYDPVFEHVPVEVVIRDRRSAYYRALASSDSAGSSTAFVEFSLAAVGQALESFLDGLEPAPLDAGSRLAVARERFAQETFSRRDYLRLFKTISTATASRDLATGVSSGALARTGDRALARYRFV